MVGKQESLVGDGRRVAKQNFNFQSRTRNKKGFKNQRKLLRFLHINITNKIKSIIDSFLNQHKGFAQKWFMVNSSCLKKPIKHQALISLIK